MGYHSRRYLTLVVIAAGLLLLGIWRRERQREAECGAFTWDPGALNANLAAHSLDIRATQIQPYSCPADGASDVAWETYEPLEELRGVFTGNAKALVAHAHSRITEFAVIGTSSTSARCRGYCRTLRADDDWRPSR